MFIGDDWLHKTRCDFCFPPILRSQNRFSVKTSYTVYRIVWPGSRGSEMIIGPKDIDFGSWDSDKELGSEDVEETAR
jgi:hypothetical protein